MIQIDNKESGKIVGNGKVYYGAAAFSPGTVFTGSFEFILIIDMKDNKYKYSFQSIRHLSNREGFSGGLLNNVEPDCGKSHMTKLIWKKIQTQGMTDIYYLSHSLKRYLNQKSDANSW